MRDGSFMASDAEGDAANIVAGSSGWGGSHAIYPAPASFFRTTWTPSDEEIAWSMSYSTNHVQRRTPGVGGWGGTCTCPDGAVYQVGSPDGCYTLACVNGVSGTCGTDNPGGAAVSVTCAPHFPPTMPPSPPPDVTATPPTPTTMWTVARPNGLKAFSDGTGSCASIVGASVFWGFNSTGDASTAQPDLGSSCAGGEFLIGTPCSPDAAPTKRYNLLFVRTGAAERAERLGLAQRSWHWQLPAEGSSLYSAAGLPQKAINRDPLLTPYVYEWGSTPMITENMLHEAYPVFRNPTLSAHPSTPITTLSIPRNWAPNWMQVSSGYFVPPVTGDYLFSVWCRGGEEGDAYLLLSPSADPTGAYYVGLGDAWHRQKLSRWLRLTAGRMYYFEFWQDYISNSRLGETSVAVRLATQDAAGNAVTIPTSVSSLGLLESGSTGCEAAGPPSCFTRGVGGSGILTNQHTWQLFDRGNSERGLDWMWRPNYVFDPIPSAFLRHSGPMPAREAFFSGARGAIRRWWGWACDSASTTQGAEGAACFNPATGALFLDEAWAFPNAMWPNAPEPSLRMPDLAPNGTETISEVFTPRTPFKGMQTYAETITAYFRPKRTARYAFRLWANGEHFGRVFFNPTGTEAVGAVEACAARFTRYRDSVQPWHNYFPNVRAVSMRATSDYYELTAGNLYYLKVYHAESQATITGRGTTTRRRPSSHHPLLEDSWPALLNPPPLACP